MCIYICIYKIPETKGDLHCLETSESAHARITLYNRHCVQPERREASNGAAQTAGSQCSHNPRVVAVVVAGPWHRLGEPQGPGRPCRPHRMAAESPGLALGPPSFCRHGLNRRGFQAYGLVSQSPMALEVYIKERDGNTKYMYTEIVWGPPSPFSSGMSWCPPLLRSRASKHYRSHPKTRCEQYCPTGLGAWTRTA